MAHDTVDVTPGVGAAIAVDDVAGELVQRVKVTHGAEGSAADASASDPLPVTVLGELVDAMEAMRMAIAALTRSIGVVLPDATGRQRIVLDAITGGLTLGAVSTVTTCSTVSALTNQVSMGGFAANDQVPALMRLGADTVRRNITVS